MRIVIVVFLLVLTAPCRADSVKDRLSILEQKLSSKAYMEIWQSVEQLRNEIRNLRGELEQQSYQLQQAKEQQTQLYEDLDQRLQALEKPVADNSLLDNGDRTEVDRQPVNDTEMSVQPEQPVLTVDLPDKDSATLQADYDKALQTLRSGHYEDSSVLFKQIVTKYPNSSLADNAQYWLAETLYINRDFKLAIAGFQRVINDYPDSPKVPDALLKIAYIQFEINKVKAGKKQLQSLIKKHPDSSAAKLARKRLKK